MSWDAALDEIADRFQQSIKTWVNMPCSYLGHEGLPEWLTVGDASSIVCYHERTFCISCTSTAYLMTCGPTHGTDPDTFRHPSTSFSGAVMH